MDIHRPKAVTPLMIASAVAVFGAWSMLIVDQGPWRRPVPSMKVAQYMPKPKQGVEPDVSGPDLVHPTWSSGLP
jgi:hypothetical protein